MPAMWTVLLVEPFSQRASIGAAATSLYDPETPISLNYGIFPKSYEGSYYNLRYILSLIKGYWSLWGEWG